MGRINDQLGANIAQIRSNQSITQRQLADRITGASGINVSPAMVSAWERGAAQIPAQMITYITAALCCTSYDLYPHSATYTERDVLILQRIHTLSDREKDILHYLMFSWPGDRRALLELDLLHAILPEYRRQFADSTIIEAYKEGIREDDPNIDRRLSTDLPYILSVFRKLDKE